MCRASAPSSTLTAGQAITSSSLWPALCSWGWWLVAEAKRKRKRKSYALRIHPRRELRKVVSLAKNPHRYPQPNSNWGPLRTSPPSRSLTSCSGGRGCFGFIRHRGLQHTMTGVPAGRASWIVTEGRLPCENCSGGWGVKQHLLTGTGRYVWIS